MTCGITVNQVYIHFCQCCMWYTTCVSFKSLLTNVYIVTEMSENQRLPGTVEKNTEIPKAQQHSQA